MIVLGIDSGGSKTAYALCDEQGQVLAYGTGQGIAPLQAAREELSHTLTTQAEALLRRAGLDGSAGLIDAVCAGMPCYGENRAADDRMRRAFAESFRGKPCQIVNDSHVAWAGSLALQPGINVVCGTGCIAFGMDPSGRTARSGGWSERFSDEGSGYWLGCKLVEVFCKQADGRCERHGTVYRLVQEQFQIDDDFMMVEMFERDFLPDRGKMAGLQRLLLDAARRGDPDAVECYRQASREIALNVKGILSQLRFAMPASVSYSGGVFEADNLVLDGFAQHVESLGCRLMRPAAPPWAGALMMGLRLIVQDEAPAFAAIMQSSKRYMELE